MQLPVLDLLARYAHLLFALVWVGHNYANFIQNPALRAAAERR